MRKATAKNLKRGKKRVVGRRRTMRGGFADVKEACAQIAAAPDANAKKKIYVRASLQFHPDKGGTSEQFAELQNCYENALAPPAPAKPKQPPVVVGKLTPEVWAASEEAAKESLYEFIRSHPKRFLKETLKTNNFLVVSAGVGATRDQIKDAMKQAGIEKPQREYMFNLIQKTYNPSYPLQTDVTVLTPV